ncbi:MAG: hypothetical protein WCS56_00255 [Bacilli bacterium]
MNDFKDFEGDIYHFKKKIDKRNALVILIETGLMWGGVKSTGETGLDLMVNNTDPLNAHVKQIILDNHGELLAKTP